MKEGYSDFALVTNGSDLVQAMSRVAMDDIFTHYTRLRGTLPYPKVSLMCQLFYYIIGAKRECLVTFDVFSWHVGVQLICNITAHTTERNLHLHDFCKESMCHGSGLITITRLTSLQLARQFANCNVYLSPLSTSASPPSGA